MTTEFERRGQDEYAFLMCCNLNHLISAWEGWDGEATLEVCGRVVYEESLMFALIELGYDATA